MTDSIPDKLSAEDRQKDVAKRDYDTTCSLSGEALAAIYGVEPSTICRDRKSDVYRAELDQFNKGRIRRIRNKGYDLVERIIDSGLDCESEQPPEGLDVKAYQAFYAYQAAKADRAARMVQWFMDKDGDIGRLSGNESPTEGGNDLLSRLFAPATELEKRNAELEAKLAVIERRLDALNGQGKQIRDEINTQETQP